MSALEDPDLPRTMVFGHPNHESVVLGLVQRLRPRIVYLTGEPAGERVQQTLESLSRLGLEDHATFLGHDEDRFYEWLLAADSEPFETIAAELRGALAASGARQVLCDAVEYYNPVHDLTLPIVRAALRGSPDVRVLTLPIIFQAPGPGEFCVQRVADAALLAARLDLREDELAKKLHAARNVYTRLAASMGTVAESVAEEHMAIEHVALAPPDTPRPDGSVFLRYEARGQLLREQGEVQDVIKYDDHYRPVAEALMGGSR